MKKSLLALALTGLVCALSTADIVQLPAIFHAQALNQANFVRYDEANTIFPTA